MVTLKDVADLAGVSISTVSRVFSGKATISDETKQKILSVAEELMFKKGLVQQHLVTTHCKVAIIFPSRGEFFHDDPSSSSDLRSIEQGFRQNGDSVLLMGDDGLDPSGTLILQRVKAAGLDGAVVFDSFKGAGLARCLTDAGVPCVVTNGIPDDPVFSVVDYNNECAMHELAARVFRNGHRDVCVLSGPDDHLVTQNRMSGLDAAAREHGVTLDPELTVSGDFSLDSGYERMKALMPSVRAKRVTVVIAFSDYIAIGALKAIKESGLSVPEDLSLVGFDDVRFAQYSDPPLSTVKRSFAGLGEVIARNLRQLIDSKEAVQSIRVLLKSEVIVRESLAVLRAEA